MNISAEEAAPLIGLVELGCFDRVTVEYEVAIKLKGYLIDKTIP